MHLLAQPLVLTLQRPALLALLAQLQVDVDEPRLLRVDVDWIGNDDAAPAGRVFGLLLLFDCRAERVLEALGLAQPLAQLGDLAVLRLEVALELGLHLFGLQVVECE